MSSGRVLAFLCACLLLLGALAWFFPEDGVSIGPVHLDFPSLQDVLTEREDVPIETVDEQLQRVSDEFRHDDATAFIDSIRFFKQFFDSSDVRIVFPGNDPSAWDSMFACLDSIHDCNGQARVVHYGDSQIEQDRITASVRSFFTTRFSGSGVGVVPPVQTVQTPYYMQTSEGDWQRYAVYGPVSMRAEHKRYGYAGFMATVSDSAWVQLDSKRSRQPQHAFSSLRVLYGQNSSDFSVSLCMGESSSSQSAPDSMLSLSEFSWLISKPIDQLVLKFTGSAEVYGILLDGESGVCVDNVPMRGGSGLCFTMMDRSLLSRLYRELNVSMVLLEYGGNTMPYITSEKEIDDYAKGIGYQIRYLRSVMPDLPILFIGPADMACMVDGNLQTYPLLETMVERLQQVCLDNGAAFWNMYRVMGGRNSIIEWASAEPPYAATDYVHFTMRGARRIGSLLENSLSVCYDYYKFRQKHGGELWMDN